MPKDASNHKDMQTDESLDAKWGQSMWTPIWRIFLYILGPALLLSLFAVTLHNMGDEPAGASVDLTKPGTVICADIKPGTIICADTSTRLQVGATLLMLAIVCIALFIVASYVLLEATAEPKAATHPWRLRTRVRRLCAFGSIVIVAAGASAASCRYLTAGPVIKYLGEDLFDQKLGVDLGLLDSTTVTAAVLSVLAVVTALVAIAVSTMRAYLDLWVDRRSVKIEDKMSKKDRQTWVRSSTRSLTRYRRNLDVMLYLGAFLLVAGLEEIRTWLRWPLASLFVSSAPYKMLDARADHILLMFGVTYMWILAFAYIPSAYLLSDWRDQQYEYVNVKQANSILGLQSAAKNILRTISLVSPFLIGGGAKQTIDVLSHVIHK